MRPVDQGGKCACLRMGRDSPGLFSFRLFISFLYTLKTNRQQSGGAVPSGALGTTHVLWEDGAGTQPKWEEREDNEWARL